MKKDIYKIIIITIITIAGITYAGGKMVNSHNDIKNMLTKNGLHSDSYFEYTGGSSGRAYYQSASGTHFEIDGKNFSRNLAVYWNQNRITLFKNCWGWYLCHSNGAESSDWGRNHKNLYLYRD